MHPAAKFRHPETSVTRPKDRSPDTRLRFALALLTLLSGVFMLPDVAPAQEEKRSAPGSVQISFLPPPLEKATYSVGIFDAKTNKLVRQLQTAAPEKDFTVGTNGLITSWDGKDETGKPAPPGRYAARGYAVGPLKIEGEEIQDNDWTADDESLRLATVRGLLLVPEDAGLVIFGLDPRSHPVVARYGGAKTEFLWQRTDPQPLAKAAAELPPFTLAIRDGTLLAAAGKSVQGFALADGASAVIPTDAPSDLSAPSTASEGRNGTVWKVEDGVLTQFSADGGKVRSLAAKDGEPRPVAVAASKTSDRIFVLEQMPGWERLRGLSWVETKEENGHPVSTWQTFFERNIRPPGRTTAASESKGASPIELNLDENPLAPGKAQKIDLVATFDAKGSYLATRDGLRLRQVSERPNLVNAYLAKGKPPSPVEFFQYDGAATDEFSIKGIHRMMEFDAGEFELTATGEKRADPKSTEPPDL